MTKATTKAKDTGQQFTNPAGQPLTKDGVIVDLTGATILFLLRLKSSPYTKYSLLAAIDGTATAGNVKYVIGSGYPTTPGSYDQEWEVTLSSGKILTFPNEGYNTLEIEEDLN